MLRNIFRIGSRILKPVSNPKFFPIYLNQSSNRAFCFSTATTLDQFSQFQEDLNLKDSHSALQKLSKMEVLQQEKALMLILNEVKYFNLGAEILVNEKFTKVLQNHTKKTVYVKSMGLVAYFLACEVATKIYNNQLSLLDIQLYKQYLQKLEEEGKNILDTLNQFQSFYFSLSFLKAQLYTNFSLLNLIKQSSTKKQLIKEQWKQLVCSSIENIRQNIKAILEYVASVKKEGNQQRVTLMKYISFEIIFDFGEEILFSYDMAKEMLKLNEKEEFYQMISEFILRAEETLNYYSMIEEMKYLVDSSIDLQSKLIMSQYYKQKMNLEKEKVQDQTFKNLRALYLKRAEKEYLQLKQEYFTYVQMKKQVEPIVESLIKWKFRLLEESGVSSEQLEKEFLNEKIDILKVCQQHLKGSVETTLDNVFEQYVEQRSNEGVQTLRFFNLDNLM